MGSDQVRSAQTQRAAGCSRDQEGPGTPKFQKLSTWESHLKLIKMKCKPSSWLEKVRIFHHCPPPTSAQFPGLCPLHLSDFLFPRPAPTAQKHQRMVPLSRRQTKIAASSVLCLRETHFKSQSPRGGRQWKLLYLSDPGMEERQVVGKKANAEGWAV